MIIPTPHDADDLFTASFGDDTDALTHLHARLVAAATEGGLLDVAYRFIDTSVGTLLLAVTEIGLVRVAYPSEGHDAVLGQLASRISPRILLAPARLDLAARAIDDYFTGRSRRFDLRLDLRLSSGFRLGVLRCLREVAYGATTSYAALAAAAGSPGAARAVGTACATNPLPVVVPCHRVIRSDGAIGNYLGGPEAKKTLLNLEAA